MNAYKNMPDFQNVTHIEIAQKLQEHFDEIDMSAADRAEINELMNAIHDHVKQIHIDDLSDVVEWVAEAKEDFAREEEEYLKEL